MLFGIILAIFIGIVCLSFGIVVGVVLSRGKSINQNLKQNDDLRRSIDDLLSINNPLYRYHNTMEQERQRTRDIRDLVNK